MLIDFFYFSLMAQLNAQTWTDIHGKHIYTCIYIYIYSYIKYYINRRTELRSSINVSPL